MTREEMNVFLEKTKRLRRRLFKASMECESSGCQKALYKAEDLIAAAEGWITQSLIEEEKYLRKSPSSVLSFQSSIKNPITNNE